MKKLLVLFMAMAMLFTLAACGGETSVSGESVSLVDVTTEQGISMKLPSDLTLQESKVYLNTKTGDNAVFAAAEIGGFPISEMSEENILATYQNKYENVAVKSFENGKQINGKESLVSELTLTTPKGNEVTMVLVIVTDGNMNYVVNLTYGTDNTDSSLANNLQACIESITIQ